MIEDTLNAVANSADEQTTRMKGVTTGRVIDVNDPFLLGRVKVQLGSVDAVDPSPWARVAVPMAGMEHGTYFIPRVGDEVLVVFEHGSPNVPYVIGALWTAVAMPPLQNPLGEIRTIRTWTGNQLVFEELSPAITLQTAPTPSRTLPIPASPTGPHQTLRMSTEGIAATGLSVELEAGISKVRVGPESISLKVGELSKIEIGPDGITIDAPSVTIRGLANGITLTGSRINLNS